MSFMINVTSTSWGQNPNLHSPPSERKKKNIAIPIVAAAGGVAIILSIGIFTILIFNRRKRSIKQGNLFPLS